LALAMLCEVTLRSWVAAFMPLRAMWKLMSCSCAVVARRQPTRRTEERGWLPRPSRFRTRPVASIETLSTFAARRTCGERVSSPAPLVARIAYSPAGAGSPSAIRPSQANASGPAPSASSSSRWTVTPAASTTSTTTGPEVSAVISPETAPPLPSETLSTCTSASWPTRAAARSAWSDSITLAIEPIAACISPMPWTVENCASWPRNWVLSSGLSGSWCLSCSVIRRRKSAWPRVVSRWAGWLASPIAPHGLSLRVLPIAVIAGSGQGSLAHRERGVGQLAGGVEDLDVGLVAARGGDHVDHLRDRVDGGGIDVAVAIGERVAGLVASDRRGPGFGDLQHAPARQFRFAGDRGRGEHRLQRRAEEHTS